MSAALDRTLLEGGLGFETGRPVADQGDDPRSPYMVRTSWTLGQSSETIADWAVKNGAKRQSMLQDRLSFSLWLSRFFISLFMVV
jgi:hypothetical protein